MKRDPNKPRFWQDDLSAEAFFNKVGASRVPVDHLNGNLGPSLTGMTTSEQAGFLVTDPAVREELLNSLNGKKPD